MKTITLNQRFKFIDCNSKKIFGIFKYVILLWLTCCQPTAIAGTACMPYSYSSVNLSLNFINTATVYSGAVDKILSQNTATAPLASSSSSECTTNTDAYLIFDTNSCGTTCIYTQRGAPTFNNNGTSVDIFFVDVENFATRSSFYDGVGVSGNPIFKIEKKITVACAGGGLLASPNPSGGITVTGINGEACDGAYSVTHTVTIYQTSSTPVSGTAAKSFQLGADINLQITLMDGGVSPTQVSYRSGVISGSRQIYLGFVSSKCTVSAPSTVVLPNENNRAIFNNSGLRVTNFIVQINAGCSSTFNQIDLFWDYQNVDTGDPTILLNDSGVNYAANVGVRISLVDTVMGTSTPVRNRTAVRLSRDTFNNRRIIHSVIFVKRSGVSDPNLITPGVFNAQATLNIRYR